METENSALKDELKNLKIKIATLSEENETLREKCSQEKATKNLTFKDFKKHKIEHEVNNEVFKCGQCDKTFNYDWMFQC